MRQVERHWIKENHELYSICDELTFKAKNLYNAGLYQIRQSFFEVGRSKGKENYRIPSWMTLTSNFRKDKQDDMLALPSKVSAAILKSLGDAMSSHYQVMKRFYDKSNTSVTRKPQLPKYLHKVDGRYVVEFINQTISKKRGENGEVIICPKSLNLVIPTKVDKPKCVRIVPKLGVFIIEVIYEIEEKPLKHTNNFAAIDLGINNLASVTFSNGVNPLLVNGKKIKSINQGYNRLISRAQSKLPVNQRTSKHIHRLWRNRETKLQNELHNITSFLSQYFDEMCIEKVFIGKNIGWKNNVSMGKKTNQKFVQVPFNTFISQLRYKCLLKGIEVIEQEESYTSKASFVDTDDIPVYGNIDYEPQFSGRRIHRGLYETKDGFRLNADINGSYNILVKGLNSIGETVDRSNVSYHTRMFNSSNHKSAKDLILDYK